MEIKRERKGREKGKRTRKEKIEKGTNEQVRKETKRPSSTRRTTRLVCKSESFRISN